MNFSASSREALHRSDVGGKAAALADLGTAGFLIPPWFVVLPSAFEESSRSAGTIFPPNMGIGLAPAVADEISRATSSRWGDDELVAVRSSALEEDGRRASFAGQFESFLGVAPAQVNERVAAVWQSSRSERVRIYRQRQGLKAQFRAPAVIIQQMLRPSASGVAFTADPVTGEDDVCIVTAVYGLGDALVSGTMQGDTWRLSGEGNIDQREIVPKPLARFVERSGGVSEIAVPPETSQGPSLRDEQVRAVAALARRVAAHFGCPQDVEWAWQDAKLFLLQSRPITTLETSMTSDGCLRLWDNSNIIESYSGVTTPLTFSFIRRAYEEVYRQFCRIMSVPKSVVARNDDVFGQMLGLIRGRVYYNLLSWYRVLAMLPGFKVNRKFMEQMMGVKEPLPDELLREVDQGSVGRGSDRPSTMARIHDALRLGRTLVGLVRNHFRLPSRTRDFHRRLAAALAAPSPLLSEMRPDQLVAYYRSLERQLLRRWDAPIVNDFFAMVFFGVLRRLAEKWLHDETGSLANELVRTGEGMVSIEPIERLRRLAALAVDHPNSTFVLLLCEGSSGEILTASAQFPGFDKAYQDYLATFGCRCFAELKLESITLRDDSLILCRTIGAAARNLELPNHPASIDALAAVAPSPRMHHSQLVSPWRRAVFQWVLRQARERVRDRENLRFERTRLFDRVRQVFLELGQRFANLQRIDAPRDIFYLQVEEALGLVEGTAATGDLRRLVSLRQREFLRYTKSAPPPNRFTTRGLVDAPNAFIPPEPSSGPKGDTERRGIACSPGRRRGRARVVTEPAQAQVEVGEILVAAQTDPGWILLFANAAGLVVERGSLLSHSAIVAREMHLPAVVGVEGATSWLRTGDMVELDGSAGTVRKESSIP